MSGAVMPEFELAMYKDGSEACRNYSRLTMQARTLLQQVFGVGGAGAVVVVITYPGISSWLYILAGIVLMVFAVSLAMVDWHYQSAFSAVRNALARLEQEWAKGGRGPWTAHLEVRQEWKDHVASLTPFFLVYVSGCAACAYGLGQMGAAGGLTALAAISAAVVAGFCASLLFAIRRDHRCHKLLDKLRRENARP